MFSLPDDDHNERIYAKVVAADRENPPDEEDVIRFLPGWNGGHIRCREKSSL